MKKVFTDPSVVPCDLLKGMLAGRGIPAWIRNERGSAGVGVGYPVPAMVSVPFAWPEVWVADDRYEDALAAAAAMKSPPPDGGATWTCKRCGEEVGPELSACWKCSSPQNE